MACAGCIASFKRKQIKTLAFESTCVRIESMPFQRPRQPTSAITSVSPSPSNEGFRSTSNNIGPIGRRTNSRPSASRRNFLRILCDSHLKRKRRRRKPGSASRWRRPWSLAKARPAPGRKGDARWRPTEQSGVGWAQNNEVTFYRCWVLRPQPRGREEREGEQRGRAIVQATVEGDRRKA